MKQHTTKEFSGASQGVQWVAKETWTYEPTNFWIDISLTLPGGVCFILTLPNTGLHTFTVMTGVTRKQNYIPVANGVALEFTPKTNSSIIYLSYPQVGQITIPEFNIFDLMVEINELSNKQLEETFRNVGKTK
ncbi:MAG: hypothetical protein OEY01_03470 [Desulfobulbaceae bacterium]|nr:hypothetical protein [Desulfobulbaceae bacterium]